MMLLERPPLICRLDAAASSVTASLGMVLSSASPYGGDAVFRTRISG